MILNMNVYINKINIMHIYFKGEQRTITRFCSSVNFNNPTAQLEKRPPRAQLSQLPSYALFSGLLGSCAFSANSASSSSFCILSAFCGEEWS